MSPDASLGGWRRGRFAHTFAAIDLGTNNCRLLIARANATGMDIVDSFSRPVRLGEGLAESGALSDFAVERTLEALDVCAAKIRRSGASRLRAIATEACRRAGNGPAFLSRVEQRTGLRFEAISPVEEARLALASCENLVDPRTPYALLIDIGGGSTEATWIAVRPRSDALPGCDLEIIDLVSIPWGVVTLTEACASGLGRDEPLPPGVYDAMVGRILQELLAFDRKHGVAALVSSGAVQMIGCSGTVTTVAAYRMGLKRYNRTLVDGSTIGHPDIISIGEKISAMSIGEIAAVPCIGPERADLALAGSAILEAICRLWPVRTVAVADRGLREGVLLDLMRQADRECDPAPLGDDEAEGA